MVEEEKILEEVRLKHHCAKMEVSIKSENLELSDSIFSKLDELRNQAEMYTKFLLEKMDDMTFVSYTNVLRREITMAWGTTVDSLTPEINPFQYAIEIKYLTLNDQTSYLIPDG